MLPFPDGDPIWINSRVGFERMLGDLQQQPVIAIDTESNSLYAYRERVCLIQISTKQRDYLIDPLVLKDLDPLGAIFSDPKIQKVFHAAEYDVICMRRDYHFSFMNIFDTMHACRILGRTAVGLGNVLEDEFGIKLEKRFQRANWGLRPLTPAMLKYARLDSHFLIALRDKLSPQLKQAGLMDLAREDFLRIAAATETEPRTENCWRVSGSQDLTPQQAAILHELCAYREAQAEAIDLPLFKILSNETLIAISQQAPETMDDLSMIIGMNKRLMDRHGPALLKAVKAGQKAPPLRRPPRPARPSDEILERLEKLRLWRKETGTRLKVESDVVLPRDTMEKIAYQGALTIKDLEPLMDHLPWRKKQYGDEIIKVINLKEESCE
ncbi:MAG TPA: HRDC domain-containing protein [Longilinea sp.]|nr:HRDC domain-containing protein [Longilinea sp.]